MAEVFASYFGAYAEAFNAFDAERIASFFHHPCLMVNAAQVTELRTPDEIRASMEALLDYHRRQGFGRASVSSVGAQSQAAGLAFATVQWTVARSDGSPLWTFRNSYNLVDHGAGWKILVSTTHEDAG